MASLYIGRCCKQSGVTFRKLPTATGYVCEGCVREHGMERLNRAAEEADRRSVLVPQAA